MKQEIKDLERLDGKLMSLVNLVKREENTINFESRNTGMDDEHMPYRDPQKVYDALIKENAAFLPIIESIATNSVGFGYSITPRSTDKDKDEVNNSTSEQETIENFFRYINADQGLTDLATQLMSDYLALGYSFCEITRNEKNKPDGMYRLQPDKIRLCRKVNNATSYAPKRIVKDKGRYVVKTKIDTKRFRLYVQYLDNGEKCFYKEFQDPNQYEKTTGKLLTTKRDINFARKGSNLANELWFFADTLTNSVYPDAKYSGSIIDALGDVHAAKTNASTFRQNLVPNLAILGDLDEGSMNRLKEFQELRQESSYNRSRFLVLKANTQDMDGLLDKGQNTIKIEKLKDEQITDSMFSDYREQNFDRLLHAFRLPKLLVSRGELPKDRAALESILKFADEQVFNPKRIKFQRFLNDYLLPELGVASLIVKFNTPDVTDPGTLIDLVRFFESSGAVTPEIATQVLEFILGKELPEVEGIDIKTPFSKTMAEAVKNSKDPKNLNQQVVGGRIKNPAKDADKYKNKR